jgi:hypothetical protein
VDLFGKSLIGAGYYFEQRSGDGFRFRLESKIQLGDEIGTLLQVCDGQYVWRYQRLHDQGELNRIDVVYVLQALEEAGQLDRLGEIDGWPGLGGMPRMLRNLNTAFDFQAAEPGQLTAGAAGRAPGGQQLPVWRLRGAWKRERLASLLPSRKEDLDAGRPIDLAQLPPQLPESVVLYLGRDDLFPYRVEYYRSRPDPKGQGRAGGAAELIVTLELFEVAVNVPIDSNRFRYNPGNLDCVDRTQEFLQQLGLREG